MEMFFPHEQISRKREAAKYLGKGGGGLGVGRRLAFVVRRQCKPPRVLWFLIAVCICTTQVASGQSGQLNGTVQQLSFQGPITGQPVNFSIYLPQGYASMTERLPVIYHLHGLDGTHNSPQINAVPSSYEAARAAGLIDPAIIVFPDGYGNSFWADSATTNKPAETNVIRELIPYVDANYQTIADRGSRVIQGFSMGGFGASMYAAKFPDVFSISVLYDGSLANWSNIATIRPDVASEIFNNSEAIFNEYSPWSWSQTNASTLAADVVGRDRGHPAAFGAGTSSSFMSIKSTTL